MIYTSALLASVIAGTVSAKTYFKESFNDKEWKSRWTVPSTWKSESELGEWGWSAGEFHGDDSSDKGIQTSEDARFYGLSAKLNEAFTNKDKELVLQMSVKHEQDLDCGGAYIKLTGDMNQDDFGGDTPYQIMFGPDVCGPSNRKTHVIFNYPPKNDNLLINNEVRTETDKLTHVYSLVVRPDGSYEVFIDLESARSGNLADDWNFLLPKEIKDPAESKPTDWVDAKEIPDPEDIKPDNWDDIPAQIEDPEAAKPEDWDNEEDGDYEAPMIPNPEFQGEWSPKMIPNSDYIGVWEHPLIPNPDFQEDSDLYMRCKDCTHVGFELWQVKSGTMFDDIIVTDSWDEAKAYAEETWGAKKDGEKAMYDAAMAEKEATRKAAADAAAEAEEEEVEDDEEEEGSDEL